MYETLRAIFTDLVFVASLLKSGGASVAVRMAVSDDDSWEVAAQTALDIHRRVISAVRNRATPSRTPKKVPPVFTHAPPSIPLLVISNTPPRRRLEIPPHTCGPALAERCTVGYDVPHEMMRFYRKHGIISLLRTRSHHRLL